MTNCGVRNDIQRTWWLVMCLLVRQSYQKGLALIGSNMDVVAITNAASSMWGRQLHNDHLEKDVPVLLLLHNAQVDRVAKLIRQVGIQVEDHPVMGY